MDSGAHAMATVTAEFDWTPDSGALVYRRYAVGSTTGAVLVAAGPDAGWQVVIDLL